MLKFVSVIFLFLSQLPALVSQNAVVAAAKMNVFYIGVDNPVEIAVPNVPSDKLEVSIDGGSIQKRGDGQYTVQVSRVGTTKIVVKANGMTTEKLFRVKPIPDPIPMVGSLRGGVVSAEVLRAQTGVIALMSGFDMDARCAVQSYTVVVVGKGEDAFSIDVLGPMFTGVLVERFAKLKSGDTVNFTDIKSRCPGDLVARHLGSINFTIK